MPRIYYDSKPMADNCCRLNIFVLSKRGMFEGTCYTSMTWTSGLGLWFGIEMNRRPHARFQHTATDSDGNHTDYDYQVEPAGLPLLPSPAPQRLTLRGGYALPHGWPCGWEEKGAGWHLTAVYDTISVPQRRAGQGDNIDYV